LFLWYNFIMENEFLTKEISYEDLSPEEKQHFSEIFEIEGKLGNYVSRNHPALCPEYYIIRYKNEGISLDKYISDTAAEMALLEQELAGINDKLKNKSNSMKRFNEKQREERLHERKINRKRNILFALLILFILFLMIYMIK